MKEVAQHLARLHKHIRNLEELNDGAHMDIAAQMAFDVERIGKILGITPAVAPVTVQSEALVGSVGIGLRG